MAGSDVDRMVVLQDALLSFTTDNYNQILIILAPLDHVERSNAPPAYCAFNDDG